MSRLPRLRTDAAAASPEQAAAVVAALEHFVRETAPAPAQTSPGERSRWARAALLEGTGHALDDVAPWEDA
ncbi:MAG: hypothetical protein WKF42_00965 [Solirubrobacteraceae bacterium]